MKSRLVCGLVLGMLTPMSYQGAQGRRALLSRVDHLVYATPDLDRTVADLERLLGVRATIGGRHPGRGTRNALISLGWNAYLEILAPDPEQPPPIQSLWLKDVREPRLVTWAANASDLDALRDSAIRNGVPLGEVTPRSRQRPDGMVLSWRSSSPQNPVADGIMPYFIDWGTSPHPSRTSVQGVTLVSLRGEHPDARPVMELLKRLGLELPVTAGPRPALIATLEGPRGRVELR